MNIAAITFIPLLIAWTTILFATPSKYLAIGGKTATPLLILLCVIPVFVYGIVFIGLRPEDAGFDTHNYIKTYKNLGSPLSAYENGKIWFGNSELLWWPIQSLFSAFLSPQNWLLINYFISFFLVFCVYKRISKFYGITSTIFPLVFLTFYFVFSGNAMRQAISLPIGIVAFFMFFEKKYTHWLTLALLATFLHWSSIIFFLAPMFRLRIFEKDYIYLALPIFALLISTLSRELVEILTNTLGLAALTEKRDLYFAADKVAHFGQIWETLNFWLCVTTSFGFLFLCSPSRYQSNAMQAYVSFFLSLILFGIGVADFAERYLPAIMMLIPAMAALAINRLSVSAPTKNFIFLFGFLALGLAVFLNKSAAITLGYQIN